MGAHASIDFITHSSKGQRAPMLKDIALSSTSDPSIDALGDCAAVEGRVFSSIEPIKRQADAAAALANRRPFSTVPVAATADRSLAAARFALPRFPVRVPADSIDGACAVLRPGRCLLAGAGDASVPGRVVPRLSYATGFHTAIPEHGR